MPVAVSTPLPQQDSGGEFLLLDEGQGYICAVLHHPISGRQQTRGTFGAPIAKPQILSSSVGSGAGLVHILAAGAIFNAVKNQERLDSG